MTKPLNTITKAQREAEKLSGGSGARSQAEVVQGIGKRGIRTVACLLGPNSGRPEGGEE